MESAVVWACTVELDALLPCFVVYKGTQENRTHNEHTTRPHPPTYSLFHGRAGPPGQQDRDQTPSWWKCWTLSDEFLKREELIHGLDGSAITAYERRFCLENPSVLEEILENWVESESNGKNEVQDCSFLVQCCPVVRLQTDGPRQIGSTCTEALKAGDCELAQDWNHGPSLGSTCEPMKRRFVARKETQRWHKVHYHDDNGRYNNKGSGWQWGVLPEPDIFWQLNIKLTVAMLSFPLPVRDPSPFSNIDFKVRQSKASYWTSFPCKVHNMYKKNASAQ